jgi:hypothetical protein
MLAGMIQTLIRQGFSESEDPEADHSKGFS